MRSRCIPTTCVCVCVCVRVQIVGNMSSLINDPKDMVPYVPLLLPELKKVLLDPSPEVRAIAARALGALVEGMGEASFPDLLPWLFAMLQADTSNVERAGAALVRART